MARRPARPDPSEDSKEKYIFEFQGFLELGKTLRIFRGRFRRNLDMGIFLISSRFLKDFFRKYNMPFHECNLRPN
jgi:hypothetical protein